MSLFTNLFKKKKVDTSIEECVILTFEYGLDSLDKIYEFRDKINNVLSVDQYGDYDGHEFSEDLKSGQAYIYGKSANTVFKKIKPIIDTTSFLKGGKATLVFGKLGTDCKRTTLQI